MSEAGFNHIMKEFFFIGLYLILTTEIVCPPGFGNKYRCGSLIKDGHCVETCYKLLSHKMDWASARLECTERSGELVSLETPEEGAFVYRTLLNKTRIYQHYWTSGADVVQEGRWMWTAVNLKIKYWNWAKGEPNESHGGEDYLSVFRHPETKKIEWNDNKGHAKISGAICEAHGVNKQDVPI